MKTAILILSAALIVVPDLAQAQAQDRMAPGADRPAPSRPGGERPGTGRPNPGRPDTGNPNPGNPNPGRPNPGRPDPGRPNPGGPQIQPPRPGAGGPQIQPPRPGTGGPQIQPPRPGRPDQGRPPVRPGQPHRPGAGRPPHFKPVHGPAFNYPRGYRYRRWAVGLLLPAIFLASRYAYTDYAPLGVGAPPYGYRWVRYGPDLLLINIRTRRVQDVIYGAFY